MKGGREIDTFGILGGVVLPAVPWLILCIERARLQVFKAGACFNVGKSCRVEDSIGPGIERGGEFFLCYVCCSSSDADPMTTIDVEMCETYGNAWSSGVLWFSAIAVAALFDSLRPSALGLAPAKQTLYFVAILKRNG